MGLQDVNDKVTNDSSDEREARRAVDDGEKRVADLARKIAASEADERDAERDLEDVDPENEKALAKLAERRQAVRGRLEVLRDSATRAQAALAAARRHLAAVSADGNEKRLEAALAELRELAAKISATVRHAREESRAMLMRAGELVPLALQLDTQIRIGKGLPARPAWNDSIAPLLGIGVRALCFEIQPQAPNLLEHLEGVVRGEDDEVAAAAREGGSSGSALLFKLFGGTSPRR